MPEIPYTGRDSIVLSYDAATLTWYNSVAATGTAPSRNWATAVDWAIKVLKATPSLDPLITNWDKIDQWLMLGGAPTLAGALVPLKGPAPTNSGFLAGDYSINDGLQGSTTKFLTLTANRLIPEQSMIAWAEEGGALTEDLINRAGPHRLRYNGPGAAVPGAIYNCFRSGGLPSGPIEGLMGFSRLNNTLAQVINALGQVQAITDVPTNSTQTALPMTAFRTAAAASPFTGRCKMLLIGGGLSLATVAPVLRRLEAVMVAL